VDLLAASRNVADVPLLVGRLEAARCSDDDVVPMPEVARVFGKHEETMRRWGRAGKSPTVTEGHRVVGMKRGTLRQHIRFREFAEPRLAAGLRTRPRADSLSPRPFFNR